MEEALSKRLVKCGSRPPRRLGLTVEGLLICDIVDQQDTHGASVISCGDGAEALLPCRIPYLQFDALSVQFDSANLEVDADGRNEGWRE